MSELLPEVSELISLAKRCQVTGYAACKRSGVSIATWDRWKHGRYGAVGPSAAKLSAARKAVIDIARERGTLPEDLAGEPA